MPDKNGGETREEYEARIAHVRATQIFGDTPTDPTIGDVVVPAHDEEAANVVAAEVDARAEDGDEEADDLSPEEAKRQLEPLDADVVQDDADARADDDGFALGSEASTDEADADLTAKEKIARIEAANSVEEVNALAAGDDRKTVKDAADKKRASWG